MRRSVKWILAGLVIAALGAGVVITQRDAITMRLFSGAVDRAIGRNVMASLDSKALHVGFCGTGSPLPNRDRAEACTAVMANGRLFIFDMGEGGGKTLALMGLPLGKTEGVWLTHLHSDHFEGLGALALQRWAGTSAATPLAVYGPEGVTEITQGLTQAFRIDSTYRIAHHGEAVVPSSGFGLAGEAINPGIVYDKNGVRITAFLVDHRPVAPAYGYRIDYNGHSATISGDTAATANLANAAKGSNLLVAELLSPRMVKVMENAARNTGQINRAKIFADIQEYHISPEDSAKAAQVAGVKMLAYTHIVPSVPSMLEGALVGDASRYFSGKMQVMHDGDLISISGKGNVTVQNLLQ